jgi:hypothetical protein
MASSFERLGGIEWRRRRMAAPVRTSWLAPLPPPRRRLVNLAVLLGLLREVHKISELVVVVVPHFLGVDNLLRLR